MSVTKTRAEGAYRIRESSAVASAFPANYPRHGAEIIMLDVLVVIERLRERLGVAQPPAVHTSRVGASDCGSPTAQSDDEYWLNDEGLTSERQFHNKLYYLVHLIGVTYQANDVDGICDCMRRLVWLDNHILGEPYRSVYDTGLVLGLLIIAHACADHFLVDESYLIAEHCALLLEAKRARRASLGLGERPDSECWYRLYELVAELKWKGNAAQRDRLFTPAAIITDYERVEARCLDYAKRTPSSDPTRNQRLHEALAWCRLQIIKMAFCWLPESTPGLISTFNELHGARLENEVGHFLTVSVRDRNNPWYWDLELFKWCALGPASEDEAYLCHQWRLDAARCSSGCTSLEAYRLATARELEHLLSRHSAQEAVHAS